MSWKSRAVFQKNLPGPMICEDLERVGAKHGHGAVEECTEVGKYPGAYTKTIQTRHTCKAYSKSPDHQRENVRLAEMRRISREERKLQIVKEHVQSQRAELEMSFKLIQVFTFNSQGYFNSAKLLLTKKVTDSLS